MIEQKPIINNESKLMSQIAAAEYLGTTVGTLNAWRHYTRKDKNGRPQIPLPYTKWGNRVRYRKEALDAWIELQSVNTLTPTTK